jgi:hypothetical protein
VRCVVWTPEEEPCASSAFATSLVLSGTLPQGTHSDARRCFGNYRRRDERGDGCQLVNGRHTYVKMDDAGMMLWFARWPDDAEVAAGESPWVKLEGGVIGRADDMLVVRGVNVFPGAIDGIVRSFPEVMEYRLTVFSRESLDELAIEIEDRLDDPRRVARELHLRLGLRVGVTAVPAGSLPRFEGKGRRIIDHRHDTRPSPRSDS